METSFPTHSGLSLSGGAGNDIVVLRTKGGVRFISTTTCGYHFPNFWSEESSSQLRHREVDELYVSRPIDKRYFNSIK